MKDEEFEKKLKKVEQILKFEKYKLEMEKCRIIDEKTGEVLKFFAIMESEVHEIIGWEEEIIFWLEDGRFFIVNLFWNRVDIK